MRESTLERYLVCEVERIGGRAPKWASPGNRGVPDRIIILPDGMIAFVEMKAPGKALEPLQERWVKILQGLGHKVFKIDSREGVDEFIGKVKAGEI